MATTVKRLSDGALLPTFSSTAFQAGENLFAYSRIQTGVLGLLGEMIQLDSVLNQKQFTLTWISGDPTGSEQKTIQRFFRSGEMYEISDTDFGIETLWATVDDVDLDNDWSNVNVNFTSQYGDFVNRTVTVLSNQSVAAGASSVAFSGTFTNNDHADAIIYLTLEASENTYWKAGTNIALNSLNFVIGAQDDYGSYNLTQRRKSVMISSQRAILGKGYYKYSPNPFFRVRPGQTITVTLAAIPNPLVSTTLPWTLKLEAISTKQKEN